MWKPFFNGANSFSPMFPAGIVDPRWELDSGDKQGKEWGASAVACNKRNELDTRELIMSIERAREKEKSIYRQVNRDVNRMPRRERITRGHVVPAGKVVAIGDSRLLTCNSKIAMHLPQKAILPYPWIFSIPIILKFLTDHELNYNFESTTFILT